MGIDRHDVSSGGVGAWKGSGRDEKKRDSSGVFPAQAFPLFCDKSFQTRYYQVLHKLLL